MKKIKYKEITPEKIYIKRRDFIKKLGLSTSSLMIGQNFRNNAAASTNSLEPTEYRYISTIITTMNLELENQILLRNLKILNRTVEY